MQGGGAAPKKSGVQGGACASGVQGGGAEYVLQNLVLSSLFPETYTCNRPTRVIYINIKKNPNLENLQKFQHIQNTSYETYTYFKIKV